ncbi:MAG TPA: hypothetical protein PKA03_09580 [Tabrizicola sp.]|nr:hypothetical protein [Tabrizicola sp.]
MFRVLALLNALLVLPFAASALAAPDFTFDQFGLDLGAEGAGIARGYGATALGWGIACLLLAGSAVAEVKRAIALASLAFNGAEVLLQVPIALSGIASSMIWVTISAHALLAALSLWLVWSGRWVRT